MATHVVRGTISFPFEMEVDIENPDDFTIDDLFASANANGHSHFGRLAFDELSDIYISDDDATVAISTVTQGTAWVEDDLPTIGVADGKGGIIWQEE
jgi:hypothetical protein